MLSHNVRRGQVIELLDGLKAKVEGDLAAEELMMEEFTKFCDSESNTKEDAITSSKRTIGDLMVELPSQPARRYFSLTFEKNRRSNFRMTMMNRSIISAQFQEDKGQRWKE